MSGFWLLGFLRNNVFINLSGLKEPMKTRTSVFYRFSGITALDCPGKAKKTLFIDKSRQPKSRDVSNNRTQIQFNIQVHRMQIHRIRT